MKKMWIAKFVKTASASLLAMLFCAASVAAQSVHREQVKIETGPTVQVSAAYSTMPHYENLAVGDPDHPGRMITCAMAYPKEAGKLCFQNCYVSFDSGKSWQPTLRVTDGHVNGDPTAVYGKGDDLYVVALVIKDLDKPKDPDPAAPADEARTVIYKSTDAGKTFAKASDFPFIDREFVGIDSTSGKHSGTIYIAGQASVRGIGGSRNPAIKLFRSVDGGKTFEGPAVAEYPAGTEICGVGTGAVLSDGTFVVSFGLVKPGRAQNLESEDATLPNAELHIIRSTDGGETFTFSSKVTDWKVDRERSEGGMLGQLAADPGSTLFKDRLYTVFPAIVDDRIQIQLSYSSDKGKTWSKPVTVNDDRSPEKGGKGPDHLLPSVSVNKDGVVLVTWYDRREAKDNLGWRLRAAASLDGGETFSSSVPVTEFSSSFPATIPWDLRAGGIGNEKQSIVSVFVGIDSFFVSGGHTSGVAVDADGTFHPTWIDNHTGIAQLWSASVKVDGSVVKHGSSDLSDLEDVSKSISMEMSNTNFDRATGTLTMTAQLKNTSADRIEGPVKIRVMTLESQLGVAEITNADNHQSGTGAVWDFSSEVSGGLDSMKLSAPKTLTFHIADLRSFGQGKDFKFGLINMDARVFGKLQKKPATDTAAK